MIDRVLQAHRSYKCRHNKFIVDERLNTVECGICGEKLNPMWVLSELCNEESRAINHLNMIKDLAEKASHKNRCKCQYCGKMTVIQKAN